MNKIITILLLTSTLFGGEVLTGEVEQQPLNIAAIVMFVLFVGATLGITYWAAKRTKSTKDFYT
ncbi:MAG: cation acetate symporter, partial [Sulfurimonadaceae bacterium]